MTNMRTPDTYTMLAQCRVSTESTNLQEEEHHTNRYKDKHCRL